MNALEKIRAKLIDISLTFGHGAPRAQSHSTRCGTRLAAVPAEAQAPWKHCSDAL